MDLQEITTWDSEEHMHNNYITGNLQGVNYTLQKLIYESSPSKVSCYAVSIKMEPLKLSYYTLLDTCDFVSVCTHTCLLSCERIELSSLSLWIVYVMYSPYPANPLFAGYFTLPVTCRIEPVPNWPLRPEDYVNMSHTLWSWSSYKIEREFQEDHKESYLY